MPFGPERASSISGGDLLDNREQPPNHQGPALLDPIPENGNGLVEHDQGGHMSHDLMGHDQNGHMGHEQQHHLDMQQQQLLQNGHGHMNPLPPPPRLVR